MKVKTLYFDIETTALQAYVWRPGDQYVGHNQLVKGSDITDIICIAYCWDKGPVKLLHWDYNKQDSRKMIQEFDAIAKEADVLIGQNSDSFDVKHINTQRLMHGLEPMPEWADQTDDLLKQVRKFFKFPSNKLDYISNILGYGAKAAVGMQDWINIQEKNEDGEKSFDKMLKYCARDVLITRKTFQHILPYIKPKFNMSVFNGKRCCVSCGSEDIVEDRERVHGASRVMLYKCNAHGGSGGRATILKNGKLGKMKR
jgi:uncharacterized protein YprB with RNaseH-like and TPR domain